MAKAKGKTQVVLTSEGGITVDGVRFRPNVPTSVSAKLADELVKGSERIEGYEFERVGDEPEPEPEPEGTDEPESTSEPTT